MRIPIRLFLLVSLIASAAMLALATPGRADTEAVITVNTTDDELNLDSDCSLREAIRATNINYPVSGCPRGSSGIDTIVLPEGFYLLDEPGVDEDDAQTGDLDIRGNLLIQGAGQGLTIVDGGYVNLTTYIDRVFHITGSFTVEMYNLTIQHGYASTGLLGGGGILNEGILKLENVLLQDNRAVNVGGAIDNLFGTTRLINSSISDNYSTKDGGGIFNNSQLLINNSTISGNTAVNGGGGLDNGNSATLENVTISGNTAFVGGGVFTDGELFVLYSSLVANTATAPSGDKGGNIENAGLIRMKTSIVANSLDGPNCVGPVVSEGHNLENTDTCNFIAPTDLVDIADPKIGPLANNGGLTMTHALLKDSPGIEAGDDIDCPGGDQRGLSRPAEGDGGGDPMCDIGAYEYYMAIYLPIVSR